MKHNAEKATALIRQALSVIGDDFALSSARRYLLSSLDALAVAQKKRDKRETNRKLAEQQEMHNRIKDAERRYHINGGVMSEQERRRLLAMSAERRLAALNGMLREEVLKLESLKKLREGTGSDQS